MPFETRILRRWLAFAVVVLGVAIAGVYVHIRRQTQDVLHEVPGKMELDIQQTAEGFRVSKSDHGRTLFTITASKAVQFKQGGAELHDVNILLYGRDSSRYDHIYGNDFELDARTGDVTAKGEVLIDLEANPKGLVNPDQSIPTELKNPIHLLTRDLVFNQRTGDAFTRARVEFEMPQAKGSARGAYYAAKDNVLTLDARVQLVLSGASPATVTAARAVFTKNPHQIVLDRPQLTQRAEQVQSEKAALFLRDNNTVERILATGDVQLETVGSSPAHLRAEQADLLIGDKSLLESAVLTGKVELHAEGPRPFLATAGRVTLDFSGRNQLRRAHAAENVKLIERPPTSTAAQREAQTVAVSALAMDFFVAGGRHLERALTNGAAEITILPAPSSPQRTVITAGEFEAKFDASGRLSTVHGAPGARIVSTTPGQPDRVSTSQALQAAFTPHGEFDSVLQQGNVAYSDGELQAWAERARYTPADQMLVLTGSPRITDQGMTTTARILRMNRATGDAFAEGDVKSTYSDLREQPNGALLASASPIHVTASRMTAGRTPSVAIYTGDARLWQNDNVVEAPTIRFDHDRRSVVADGNGQPVSTVLVQVDKQGNATPVSITATRLTYTDDEHRAHFEGDVLARGADVNMTAKMIDAFLLPRNQLSRKQALSGPGQLDHIVAEGDVVVQSPTRRATGEKLVYTASADKFVLTGGPPSIFDAEHGKITGVSLTFYNRDDRVLVEGRETSPAVTQTRVAR
ncbi:MAG TPA: LptA/OstA family protein [Terriglobales bacterium]|nr:LptA/OstA family protein [Terriglobales bacterium]